MSLAVTSLATVTDGLDSAQREAVLTEAQPLCIVAGAGSGKTSVLTKRIVRRALDGSADMSHVLAITFTRKAAGELNRRLTASGIRDRATVGTFHAVAWSVLRQRAADLGRKPPQVLASRSSLVRELLSPRYDDAAEVTAEIDWARARRITPANYIAAASHARRTTRLSPGVIAEHFEAYEGRKKGKRLVDFDDLLEGVIRDIERDRQFASVMRWRFRHLFVDEFQDINPLQLKLLESWRAGRPDLCVVGDPSQSIYGWNGADPDILRNIEQHVPGIAIVRLAANHRSSPQVVEAGRRILGDGAPEARATRPDGPAPIVASFADERAEGRGIAELLDRHRLPARRWSTCAVLTRTNSQLNAIDDALHDAGIPTRRRTGRTLFDNPAVRRQMSDDNESLRDWLAELQTTLAEGDHGVGVASDPATVEALRALVARGYEHLDAQPGATVGTFRIAMMSPDEFGFDGVDLLSFHAAKGLEWDTVVIAGAEKGLIPHASAVGTAGAAEERRLFYVAVTRATRQVIATWAQRRGTQTRDASKLLDALTRPFDDATDNDAPVPRPVRVRPPSDPRHDALLAWRDATARAANVESSFVLADRTLDAIILAAPRDESELAAVSGVGPLLAARFGEAILHTLHR